MSNVLKRPFGGGLARAQQDLEFSMARAKDDTLEAAGRYEPGDPNQWVPPAPTTIQEALDRLAANTANAHPIP